MHMRAATHGLGGRRGGSSTIYHYRAVPADVRQLSCVPCAELQRRRYRMWGSPDNSPDLCDAFAGQQHIGRLEVPASRGSYKNDGGRFILFVARCLIKFTYGEIEHAWVSCHLSGCQIAIGGTGGAEGTRGSAAAPADVHVCASGIPPPPLRQHDAKVPRSCFGSAHTKACRCQPRACAPRHVRAGSAARARCPEPPHAPGCASTAADPSPHRELAAGPHPGVTARLTSAVDWKQTCSAADAVGVSPPHYGGASA